MFRLFKLSPLRLLSLGGAKASTQGPIAGEQLEEEFVPYNGA